MVLSAFTCLCHYHCHPSPRPFHLSHLKLYSLNNFSFPLPPAPCGHHSTFCLSELHCCRYLKEVESYSICPFMSDLFHLAHLQGSSMNIVACVSLFFCFNVFCLFICQWTCRSLPSFGCCKQCCCEHGCTNTRSSPLSICGFWQVSSCALVRKACLLSLVSQRQSPPGQGASLMNFGKHRGTFSRLSSLKWQKTCYHGIFKTSYLICKNIWK